MPATTNHIFFFVFFFVLMRFSVAFAIQVSIPYMRRDACERSERGSVLYHRRGDEVDALCNSAIAVVNVKR
jgi:hypothetical protein